MLLDRLISLIAPHECLSCTAEGSLLCPECQAALQPPLQKCYKCQAYSKHNATCAACRPASPLSSVHAAAKYQGVAKDIVWKLKFGRARAGGGEIGGIINRRLGLKQHLASAAARSSGMLIITHAPTANRRVRQRGYDQAALIARTLSAECGVPYRPLLRRYGRQEQIGAGRGQRAAQLEGAFCAISRRRVQGKHIILVDDVVTTGATLEAAARALMDAGARRVDAIVFAQA